MRCGDDSSFHRTSIGTLVLQLNPNKERLTPQIKVLACPARAAEAELFGSRFTDSWMLRVDFMLSHAHMFSYM